MLLFAALGRVEVSLVRGQESPRLGWWSDRLESYVPAWLAAIELEATGTVELATLVIPFAREAPSVDDIELRLESRDEGTVITIEPDGQRIELDLASPTPTVTRVRLAATA